MRKLVLLALLSITLSGCGLRPLYSGGSKGAVAQALGQVEVAPIDGKAGWLVRNAIVDRLGAMPDGPPLYRLKIELDDQITGFGIRADDSVTRERRSLRARYQLIEAGRGTVVLDATAGSDAGIDIVSSEYATIAAENTALENLSQTVADQIVARLALYAQRTPDEGQ
jgi:LPS-assembly lipoprotein